MTVAAARIIAIGPRICVLFAATACCIDIHLYHLLRPVRRCGKHFVRFCSD